MERLLIEDIRNLTLTPQAGWRGDRRAARFFVFSPGAFHPPSPFT
jgi:hypothetical protein